MLLIVAKRDLADVKFRILTGEIILVLKSVRQKEDVASETEGNVRKEGEI